MIDINTILTQALAAAVAEATKPLVERIAALETRLLALENNPAQGVDTTLETRLLALDEHNENAPHFDKDDIEEIVQKLLNSASISITV